MLAGPGWGCRALLARRDLLIGGPDADSEGSSSTMIVTLWSLAPWLQRQWFTSSESLAAPDSEPGRSSIHGPDGRGGRPPGRALPPDPADGATGGGHRRACPGRAATIRTTQWPWFVTQWWHLETRVTVGWLNLSPSPGCTLPVPGRRIMAGRSRAGTTSSPQKSKTWNLNYKSYSLTWNPDCPKTIFRLPWRLYLS